MTERRRKFSPQFKAEAVQMVIETGKPIAEVARGLGVHDGTLGNWVNAWRRDHPEPDLALTPVERARVKELEDENRRPPQSRLSGRPSLSTLPASCAHCIWAEGQSRRADAHSGRLIASLSGLWP
jgi:transposase